MGSGRRDYGEAFENGGVCYGVDAGPRVSESVSALCLAAHSSVGPLPCNRTSQDWAAGNVAGLDRTPKQGILNLRFQYEVEDTLDVTLVSVRC